MKWKMPQKSETFLGHFHPSCIAYIFLLKERPPFRRKLLTEVAPFPKNVVGEILLYLKIQSSDLDTLQFSIFFKLAKISRVRGEKRILGALQEVVDIL